MPEYYTVQTMTSFGNLLITVVPTKVHHWTYFELRKYSPLLHTLFDKDPFEFPVTSGRLVTAKGRLRSQSSPYQTFGEASGTGKGTSLSSAA